MGWTPNVNGPVVGLGLIGCFSERMCDIPVDDGFGVGHHPG